MHLCHARWHYCRKQSPFTCLAKHLPVHQSIELSHWMFCAPGYAGHPRKVGRSVAARNVVGAREISRRYRCEVHRIIVPVRNANPTRRFERWSTDMDVGTRENELLD